MNKLLLTLLSIGILSTSLNSCFIKESSNISKNKSPIETLVKTNIKDIPGEVFGEIFSFSSFKDIDNVRDTCRCFKVYSKVMAINSSPMVWILKIFL